MVQKNLKSGTTAGNVVSLSFTHSTATTTDYSYSGKVRLAEKPTAYLPDGV